MYCGLVLFRLYYYCHYCCDSVLGKYCCEVLKCMEGEFVLVEVNIVVGNIFTFLVNGAYIQRRGGFMLLF